MARKARARMIRLLSPFGPKALPIDSVSRTNSTSDGVMTMLCS